MVDKPPAPPCGSSGPSKHSGEERDSRPSAPTTVPSPEIVPQTEIPNPETFPPMESDGARRLPRINIPIEGDRPAHPAQPYGTSHPQQLPPSFFPQNGPLYPGTAAPMVPRAVYPMPFMSTMGFYPPVMPMPYGGYHPHPANYPTFANGYSTPQHFTGTNGHQSQFNNVYQPAPEMVSLPDDSAMNRLVPPKPFPNSANALYKEADNQLPLPSFRSLENATRRSVSGEPSQVLPRCRSPLSNPPSAKKRRVDISAPGLVEIQANSMNGCGPASIEKGGSTPANEKQQCTANASIGSPSNRNRSEIANTGSTPKSTAGSSKKSCGNMSIKDIVHPSETQLPAPNPTQTDQSDEPIAPKDAPHIGCQNVQTAPYPRAPPHVIGMPNMGPNYFANPYHEFRHYPSIAKMMWNTVHRQGYAQGYGSTLPGQASNLMGMSPHQAVGHQSYSFHKFHPMPSGYARRSSDIDPQGNGRQNGYGSRLSMPPHPIRQHAVQIAPAPSGSSQGNLASSSAQEYPLLGVDLPDRQYDLAAIEKLGCKVLKWRVYNEQGHPVCAAPRENGVPCRRNVSKSACKWHGLVVPLRPENSTNGRLDADGNLIESSTPQEEAPEAAPSENRVSNDRSLRSRGSRAPETPDSQSRVHRWNDQEHFLFLLGHKEFGKSWAKISKIVQSRTTLQTQSHAQKFFERRRKQEKKKSTIHDLVFESPEMQAIYNSTPKEVLGGYLARAFARDSDQRAKEQPRDQEQANDPNSDE